MIIIDASGITKFYGHGNARVVAIEDFHLQVREGEFLSIIGPSGCGKTTFLMLAAGLEEVPQGVLRYKGQSIEGCTARPGIVFQEYALFPWRTVAANIGFGPELQGIANPQRGRIVEQYVDLVGLHGFENAYPSQLSGGMRQRVAIARALAVKPDILLMDEPFGSLDALTREMMQVELLRIWQKTKNTVIFVTHNINEAVYLSDRVAVMSKRPGRIKVVIPINLTRPRTEDTMVGSDFTRYVHELRQLVYDEVSTCA